MTETLMHTTVRLKCTLADGSESTGTAFFFSFKVDEKSVIPLIVTNKHVIKGAVRGAFALTHASGDTPVIGEYTHVALDDFEQRWVKHPMDEVDLAVLPLAPLLHAADKQGIKFFAPPFMDFIVPNEKKLGELTGLESIVMIGYPNGIWDWKNNLPIIRRGITATSPKHDYNGLPEFVIDCACFPGSSGSPVLIFDQGSYADANGNLVAGSRVMLLGILASGPQHIAQGKIKVVDTPLSRVPISLSQIPNNLGFVVKASKLLEFRELL